MISSPIRQFLVAWQLLTSVPLGKSPPVIPRLGRAMAWFPLVGLVIGSGLVILDKLLSYVLPPLPLAAILLAAWVAVTGGLHLDGFIDCCDGLLGSRDGQRRLEIMKDSRVGAFGVLGAVCLLLVKFSALATLEPHYRLGWLLVTPVLGRWAMVWAAWRYPLARPDGFAATFRDGIGWPQLLMAAGTALAAAVLVLGWPGLVAFVVAWLLAILVAAWVRGRIPGLTGDVYGAVNELAETLVLLCAIILGGTFS